MIKKILTDDGTISFYNEEFGDIYHSQVGAYTETLEKFIKPSRILETLHNKDEVYVLDVCFGLGYNSKVLVSEILKNFPTKKVTLLCVELDPEIIGKAKEINFPGYTADLKTFFDAFTHKVYYSHVSSKNMESDKITASYNNITLHFFVGDARQVLQRLNYTIDFIFHDAFSPKKCPELWTTDFFKLFYGLTKEDGVVVTYSSSYAVRGGLKEAGFLVGATYPVGRKSPGTMAAKLADNIYTPFTPFEHAMIDSNAGIPYKDPTLNGTKEVILQQREDMQRLSTRQSSSSIRKAFGVKRHTL